MLTPQPYLTILRLEREARENRPHYLREVDDERLEMHPAPLIPRSREHPRLRTLMLSLRAFLF